MGALLACGVYGASSLRFCGLGCSSWLVLLFMSLLSFTCSCGGMAWSQVCGPSCCSCVLGFVGSLLRRSVALAYGRTLSFSCFSLGFFFWCLFGLGLVGCGPAWVPAFFWGGTLLPLSWLFSLGDSYCVVVQAPRVFLELFPGVLSSRFQFLLIARGGCG